MQSVFRLTTVSIVAVFGFLVLGVFGIGPDWLQPLSPSVVEANHCGGEAQCNAVTPHLCLGDCKASLTCTSDGTLKIVAGSCGASSFLTITNVSHGTPGSDRATITWTTSIAASTEVRYGLTSSLGSSQINAVPNSTSHSITITGLQPSTTYYYQAYSKTSPDPDDPRATSSIRNFTTSSGVVGGTLPTITLGPTEYVNINTARITFRTNVPTAALIEFSTDPNTQPDPGNPGYSQVCDFPTNCSSPPPQPNVLNVDHTVNLTGLTQASSPYFYRITIIDANRNVFALEDRFTTTSSSSDYTFSTGDCDDGTPIRQCNADRQYCRPGNRTPVFDCRPDINCPYTCPGGATCSESGDCVEDPSLGDSSTQCNPKTCYLKCDGNSGGFSGRRCGTDADCSGGKCIVGSFTIPAGSGCYASWPSCDANVILKVRPDRICDKWLTCKTSLPVKDVLGKTQNQCLDLTICDSLSPNGQCNNLLEGRQCDNDPLRFCASDADCPGGSCLPANEPQALTFRTPEEVSQISGLTGYAMAGLNFHELPDSPSAPTIVPIGGGFYPLSLATQVGTRFDIPNGNFEETVVVQVCQGDITQSCVTDDNCTGKGKCIFRRDSQRQVSKHWEPIKPTGSTKDGAIAVDADTSRTNSNHMLKITPTDVADSGARTTSAVELNTSKQNSYLLSLRMRSDQNDQPVTVKLINSATNEVQVMDEVLLTTGWQPFLFGPKPGVDGPTRIAFTTPVTGEPVSFYIDDLAMLPALKVSDTQYIPQACRLYPNDSAPSCDFTDANGLQYKGLKGYCLERDPLNSAVCLSWWPVDTASGSGLSGTDELAGYEGGRPLYYCAESTGTSSNILHFVTRQGGIIFPSEYIQDAASWTNALSGSAIQIPLSDIAYFDVTMFARSGHWGQTCSTNLPELTYASSLSVLDYRFRIYANARSDEGANVIAKLMYLEQGKDDKDFRCTSTPDPDFTTWGQVLSDNGNDTHGGGDSHDFFGLRIHTTGTGPNDKLSSVEFRVIDDDDSDVRFEGDITAVLKNTCTKFVQVATSTSDSAWADRTSPSSTYVVPDLNYRQVSDLEPFAAVASPAPADDPSQWSSPVTLEGPYRLIPEPFQPRSGGPFACTGATSSCNRRYCDGYSGSKYGEPCVDSGDCSDDTSTGTCLGGGVCMEYIASAKSFEVPTGTPIKGCTNTTPDCCAAGDKNCKLECIGGAATNRGTQTLNNSVPALSDPTFTQYHVMRLFAKAFSLWKWNNTSRVYEKDAAFVGWNPPTTLCKVCSGGTQNSKACTNTLQCGLGGTCVDAARHPETYASLGPLISDPKADYCAIKPSITNISDAGKVITIDEGASYTLRFNSNVDLEQQPLREIAIDWGDGTITDERNLRLLPRDDPNKPHAVTHTYHCAQEGVCIYYTKLRIKDNWDWCDNGLSDTPCRPVSGIDTSTWQDGPTVQVLR